MCDGQSYPCCDLFLTLSLELGRGGRLRLGRGKIVRRIDRSSGGGGGRPLCSLSLALFVENQQVFGLKRQRLWLETQHE